LPPTAFDVCISTTGQIEIIEVDPQAEWASINIISAANTDLHMVSIDEHPLWIYAVDGRYIEPMQVDAIAVPNGNRYSAIVKLDKKPGDYMIRVPNSGINQVISGTGILRYKGFSYPTGNSVPYINNAAANITPEVTFFDQSIALPFPPIKPSVQSDATFHLAINHTNESWAWTLDGATAFQPSLENIEPMLFDPSIAAKDYPGLVITTKMGQWVDLIIQVLIPLQGPHPLHKHANKGFIIGAGNGPFRWTNVAEAIQVQPAAFNLESPPYRDGFLTLPTLMEPSWLVVRYQVVNPGVWQFHCRKYITYLPSIAPEAFAPSMER
jgi:FtsP/CotA-like multicopper oxidase with cupredoxin domain